MSTTTTQTARTVGQMYRVTLTDQGRRFISQNTLPEPVLATPDAADDDWVLLSPDIEHGWLVARSEHERAHLVDAVADRLAPGTKGHYVRGDMVATFEPLAGDAAVVTAAREEAAAPVTYSQEDLDAAVQDAERRVRARADREHLAYKEGIREALITEGERRDWCDELDDFLSDNGFEPRVTKKNYEVTLTVEFQTTVLIEEADDEDDAIERAKADFNGYATLDPFQTLNPQDMSVSLDITDESAEEQ